LLLGVTVSGAEARLMAESWELIAVFQALRENGVEVDVEEGCWERLSSGAPRSVLGQCWKPATDWCIIVMHMR